MKKTMILIMAVATTIKATAQSVTYNHDSSKQNQITVMETGGGSLTLSSIIGCYITTIRRQRQRRTS